MSSFRRFKIKLITKNSQGFYLLSGITNGGMIVKNAKLLHTIKKPTVIVDELSGEVVTIHPPVKKSTSGLKVSIR